MKGYVYLSIGIFFAVLGAILWSKQERYQQIMSWRVAGAIALILFGAVNILFGIDYYIHAYKNVLPMKPRVARAGWKEWLFIIGMIFIGSVSYTIAAYYHLKIKNWSFLMAFAIAIPLILIEYQFSIRGNHAAKDILNLNAIQITLITMAFYFVNSWVINMLFLKQKVIWWRETLAFVCIIAAFLLSTTSRN
jgi:uncharacterized protein (DUF486 family)